MRELDRLSRNLAKQLIVEEELKRAGVSIEYVLGEYPDNPEGDLMKHVRASIAEYERMKISERNMRGRYLKAKAGSVMCWKRPPFGYRQIEVNGKHCLEIIESEARIVAMIFDLYTITGDDNGRRNSLNAITTKLSAMGVSTVADSRPGYYKARARRMVVCDGWRHDRKSCVLR